MPEYQQLLKDLNYDALAADPEVLRKMQDEVLVEMAYELTELIRRSRTVDWDKKESARAYENAGKASFEKV